MLAGRIKTEMEKLGSASFQDLKPGLDVSLNSAQGNLALFDGIVPLMNFGLGTRRLAATAVQQLAHQGSAVLLVDEVEYGLEPHRLVHLLNRLRQPGIYAKRSSPPTHPQPCSTWTQPTWSWCGLPRGPS